MNKWFIVKNVLIRNYIKDIIKKKDLLVNLNVLLIAGENWD
jgi:hypothetical protein